jgi:predicted RNA-binding Zn ribbon-like protein
VEHSPVRSSDSGTAAADDEFLLALLNSTPIIEGISTDALADVDAARAWRVEAGGRGTEAELAHIRRARSALQAIVRGERPVSTLEPLLRGVTYVPHVGDELTWTLQVKPERELAVRAILAWEALVRESPARLRACANDECRLFLIDRSTANRARWCSMAVCGNRMKARRHYQRTREASRGTGE